MYRQSEFFPRYWTAPKSTGIDAGECRTTQIIIAITIPKKKLQYSSILAVFSCFGAQALHSSCRICIGIPAKTSPGIEPVDRCFEPVRIRWKPHRV